MELNDAARRVVGHHWRLILAFVLAAGALVAIVHGSGAQTYTATARLVLDTEDPKSRSESTSIADTARALATSPAQVRGALRDAHVRSRDALDIARHHVGIQGLGTSAVLQLSVSDRSAAVAAAVANALAGRIIQTRLSFSNGQLRQALEELDRRIADSNEKISTLDASIDSLNVQSATAASAREANALRARADTASRQRDFLAQQRSVLESERVSLISADAQHPKPSVISAATLPAHADASSLTPDLLLGMLLGLVASVAIAGLLEAVRPTVVGGDALAQALGAPYLGTISRKLHAQESQRDVFRVAERLRLAADAAGVEEVRVVAAVAHLDVLPLVKRLAEAPPLVADGKQGLLVRPGRLTSASRQDGGRDGVVLVSPRAVKKAELDDAGEVLRLARVNVLGLIAYGGAQGPASGSRRSIEQALVKRWAAASKRRSGAAATASSR